MPDVTRPHNDPYALIGENWPAESESAYHTAKIVADDSSVTTSTQAQSARDAEARMADEQGQTADAVSGGYGSSASTLQEQSIAYTTISAWMVDAEGKVGGAKKHIASLVSTGTLDIRDAIASEVTGTPVSPSSAELTSRYRNDISSVASKLSTDLEAIGHSLHGDAGSSNTPSYVSVPTTSNTEQHSPATQVVAYNTGQRPAVEPQQLPEMPRASAPTPESPSTPGTPSTPIVPTHAVNPTLSNLVAGSASPSGTPNSPSAKSSSSATPAGTPAGKAAQASQPTEQRQNVKSPVLPRIPSVALPDLPAAAQTIATAVTSAAGQQLPTAPSAPGSSLPVSTGITPGTSGTAPMTPAPPAGLSPIGGGLPTAPVVQAPPVAQGTPAAPPPGVQAPAPQQSPAPAPPRGPVADLGWIQRTYGLSPGVELPKAETTAIPAVFIANLAEGEAHLHRVLATIRHQFEGSGWSQPLAVARIKRGVETKLVYVTADGLSIHPSGVLLPQDVTPLDEMPSGPSTPELLGSLMVTDKLDALIPRTWEVEHMLSTVSGGEGSQSIEEFQELVESGELLPCMVSRGRDDVTDDEAMRVFTRASLGSAGCGELDVESARIRAARWIGTQPADYLEVLARWHLADAAESMSQGSWGEAVYSSEKYMSVRQSKAQAA